MAAFTIKTEAEEVAVTFADQIRGKTIIVTGPTKGGIGGETARVIAKHQPGTLVLAGRSSKNLDDIATLIKKESPDAVIRNLILDLGSLESVRAAAKEVLSYPGPVDIVINNAGIMAVPFALTPEGFERHFGTNHLGHFLFTNLIMPKLRESSVPRVVNVSSRGHIRSPVRFDDFNFGNGTSYHKFLGYGQSKTANILFSVELASRFKQAGLTAFSVHPGVIPTNLARDFEPADYEYLNQVNPGVPVFNPDGTPNLNNPVYKTLGAGAATQTRAAFDPTIANHSGSYLSDCQIANDQAAAHALDKNDAARLWKLSEELVGQTFSEA